jgi:hypothetical protein
MGYSTEFSPRQMSGLRGPARRAEHKARQMACYTDCANLDLDAIEVEARDTAEAAAAVVHQCQALRTAVNQQPLSLPSPLNTGARRTTAGG